MKWHLDIFKYLQVEDYTTVANFYEKLIEVQTETSTNHCLLGLAYLLGGREEEANTIWLHLLGEIEEKDELLDILEAEATRQKNHNNLPQSLVIREYIREVNSALVDNQLEIILLRIKLNTFEVADITQLIPLIQDKVNSILLLEVISAVLKYPYAENLDLVRVSLPYLDETFLKQVEESITKKDHNDNLYCIDLIEISLTLKPDNIYLLNHLHELYWATGKYTESENTIKKLISYLDCSSKIDLKLYGAFLQLHLALKQGKWLEIESILKNYHTNLEQFSQEPPDILEELTLKVLPSLAYPLLYLQDNLRETRLYQNRLSSIFQKNLRNYVGFPEKATFLPRQKSKSLKIGYLASTLRRHSVGWLSRWLFKYHDKENFTIYLYLINQPEDDITFNWFRKNAHQVYNLKNDFLVIAEQISSDQIDILVDLDSLTIPTAYRVMALKPAPIQVTWLGFDTTGIPNVDYFIVDPYVLPENAQQYYQEKIWRLPKTHLAIGGFEIGTPTITRKELNIPLGAVTYLTAQTVMKRHPETIRMQLKILKEVPNSYLLIKGHDEVKPIEILFTKLAQEEGIEIERLRFLSKEPEETHYANLQIADVVLDTYPFGGATTTLGFLWIGLPIVTLVGEQFTCRNSYSFMLNAGITEGIAFTREEYIEWGVKLGLNEELRSSIHWKLLKNRQTAPLWNAKEFTLEMEKAYYEMASRNL